MDSKLAYIDINTCGPFELLRKWIDEYKINTLTDSVPFSLATGSSQGNIMNRFVLLQSLDEDGLVFMSNLNSPKAKHIAENPQTAACFLLSYPHENLGRILRQVRIQGMVEKLPQEVCEEIYNKQPLYAKIRSCIIQEQSVQTEWNDLKQKHDETLEQFKTGKIDLRMPEHIVAYKILPTLFDFYHAGEDEVADRVVFTKSDSIWTHSHVSA